MRHTIETAPNVVILEASHAWRGFAICRIAQTLVTVALIGMCLHAGSRRLCGAIRESAGDI